MSKHSKAPVRITLYLTGLFALVLQASAASSADLPAYSQYYDPNRDPATDGRAALQLARRTGRRVLIEVGGDWCSWCHRLDRFIHRHSALRAELHREFVVLKVNVSEENDNADFMAGLPEPLGYPHVYIADSDGRILHSQDTAAWLVDGSYSPRRFRQFLNRWKSNAPQSTRN
jgi:thiol:disulfide interchange protein